MESNALSLLEILAGKGIKFNVEGERLICDAPQGIITNEIAGAIKANKSDIIRHIFDKRGNIALGDGAIKELGQEIAPLTHSQERLLLIEHIMKDVATFNLPVAIKLYGRIDVAAFKKALQEIVDRHAMLRTSFVIQDEAFCQKIHPKFPVELKLFDYKKNEAADLPDYESVIVEEGKRPFNLESVPLISFFLFLLNDDESVFFFNKPSIIWDGWSYDIFLSELNLCYEAFRNGQPSPLHELCIQFGDYSTWHKRWVEGPEVKSQVEFWRKKLPPRLPKMPLPFDRSRSSHFLYRGARIPIRVSVDKAKRLAEICKQENSTLSLGFLAIFKVLLFRITEQNEVLIAMPMWNRVRPETEDLIGHFVNIVLMHTRVKPESTYREFLRELKSNFVEAFNNQEAPFEIVVQELNFNQGRSRAPIYQVYFSYQDARNRLDNIGNLTAKMVMPNFSSATNDLSFWLKESENEVVGAVDYSIDLFDKGTIEKFIAHFLQLLDSCLENPDKKVNALAIGKIDRKIPPDAVDESEDAIVHSFVPANDPLEMQLTKIWESVLKIKPIGINDNFFEIGGHSLLATRLFSRIEETIGVKLPLATLFRAPTVELMAMIIRNKDWRESWSSLVPVRAGGSKPPLFFIHGAGGNVLLYRELSLHLGPEQPFYGLQSQGLDGTHAFSQNFEQMAAQYLREIRSLQPEGPYYLGGYCLGGAIALELAQQLLAQGQTVAFLAMIETYNIHYHASAPPFYNKIFNKFQNVIFHWDNLMLLNSRDKFAFLTRKFHTGLDRKKAGLLIAFRRLARELNTQSGDKYPHINVTKFNDQAHREYRPMQYKGKISLFRPKRHFSGYNDYEFGWGNIGLGGVDVHELPISPKGMLVEPFVRQLADRIRECLRVAEAE